MNESVAQRINVGVDTGKDFLDIHARPLNALYRYSQQNYRLLLLLG